jgi:anti-sigma regulatory factor (Ser/Thr protein kinase)
VTIDVRFRHEALLYAGGEGFLAGTTSFIKAGIVAGEPILVVVSAEKIGWLRSALGPDADAVHFADMAGVGANPARIIPAWRAFVDANGDSGRPLRGIGEPIWAARTPAELVECQRHENLLNLAFDGSPAWWLLCPYDTAALPAAVLAEAQRSHPFVVDRGHHRDSDTYRGLDAVAAPFDAPLPPPPSDAFETEFDGPRLGAVRRYVAELAAAAGLDQAKRDDLVVSANEIASNSLRHGGGGGTLRLWETGGVFICEVSDRGFIDAPMVGREQPPIDSTGGRGVWLANHLCDLVQLRSSPAGTVVRLHMTVSEAPAIPLR